VIAALDVRHKVSFLLSSPPQIVQISLAPRDQLTLTLEKKGDFVSHVERRDHMQHSSCEDVIASIERLEAGQELQTPLQTAIH